MSASYSRRMRRAAQRGKKPEEVTYKTKPHKGKMALYDHKDSTITPTTRRANYGK